MTLHLVIEYNWLYELGAHTIFFCPRCHCCYIPRMWIRIRVYVWRWVSACKYIYTYMYVLVLTYISVHMGIVIFLLHIMYYVWMICPMQLLFNFGNKLIFIVIVLVIVNSLQKSPVTRKMFPFDHVNCPYPWKTGAYICFCYTGLLCHSARDKPFPCKPWGWPLT